MRGAILFSLTGAALAISGCGKCPTCEPIVVEVPVDCLETLREAAPEVAWAHAPITDARCPDVFVCLPVDVAARLLVYTESASEWIRDALTLCPPGDP